MYVCMFFKDFSRLRALPEPKMVPYGRMVDNTLLRHVFSAVVIPARAWHAIEVPIGLTLWSGQWGRGTIFEFYGFKIYIFSRFFNIVSKFD